MRLTADLDALFEAVPTLRELTVQNMWFEAPAAEALFAARHFGHFQKLALGTLSFDRPFAAEGELTLRISSSATNSCKDFAGPMRQSADT